MTLVLIRYFIKGTLVGIRVNDPDFQQKRLMETSIRMGFFIHYCTKWFLSPVGCNVRKNDCFVCKLLIGFFCQVQQTSKSDRMISLIGEKKKLGKGIAL